MLKISNDTKTKAIQRDVHAEMEARGEENFFEFLADVLCCEVNTARNLMKKGNFSAEHLFQIKAKTKAEHLSKLMINTFARTEC